MFLYLPKRTDRYESFYNASRNYCLTDNLNPFNTAYMNQHVFVFATSVQTEHEVMRLKNSLDRYVGQGNWNFALDDSDNILRIVSAAGKPQDAVHLLRDHGYTCRELE